MALASSAVRVVTFDTVGSTNTEAIARARAGESGPLWIVARRQEAGRGRHGRAWVSQAGNLFASLLLTDPGPPERAAELSFVAALAAHDAIARTAGIGHPDLSLKWPNDLLLGSRKCGGILIESERCGAVLATVIGIGINCAHHPENTACPATDLSGFGAKVLPEQVFEALQAAMTERIDQWARGSGFGHIRACWLARAAGLGERVSLSVGDRVISGKMKEISPLGQLVVEVGTGACEVISAGEIVRLSGPAAIRQAP